MTPKKKDRVKSELITQKNSVNVFKVFIGFYLNSTVAYFS